MPTICPHCHKLVSEQLSCPFCGKPMKVTSDPERFDREDIFIFMRYALLWTGGIVAVGFLCIMAIYLLLA